MENSVKGKILGVHLFLETPTCDPLGVSEPETQTTDVTLRPRPRTLQGLEGCYRMTPPSTSTGNHRV